MNYGQIRKYDIANGDGIRTSLFVTGCTHNCYNCFNKEYQDPQAGTPWDDDKTEELLSYLSADEVRGLTILGGEPFQNVNGLLPIVKTVKDRLPKKDIWIYSGYTFEELIWLPEKIRLLMLCDILVDGRYVDALRDPSLAFRGSSNQRIIDVQKSLLAHKAVLSELHT